MQTKILILIFTLGAIAGQLLLKRAIADIGTLAGKSDVPRFLFAAVTSPWVHGSLILQVVGYVLWMVIISKEKLGVAFAMSGSGFYLLLSLSAWIIFDERLSLLQWAGILLVTVGVVCLTIDLPNGARVVP